MPASAEPAPQPGAAQPVVLASVPMPKPAPQPKEGEAPPEQPKSIAGLLGNLFGGAQAQAAAPPAPAPTQTAAVRSNTHVAAKSKSGGAVMRTASIPPAKPHETATARPPKDVPAAKREPAPKAPAPEMRTAYQAPQSSNGSLLSGAQPVVPAGSFESRWTALR
jgi:hypothetical protein